MLKRNRFRIFIGIIVISSSLSIGFGWTADYQFWTLPKFCVLPQMQLRQNLPSIKVDKKILNNNTIVIGSNVPINRPKFVYTNWHKGYGRRIHNQNAYNGSIALALREWPDLDLQIFKSILIQESDLISARRNHYGYAGIAQLGRKEAVSSGLVIAKRYDERYDYRKAIIAGAIVLRQKALHLEQSVFSYYGRPRADEYWKFIAAAYNAGEGTIAKAMKYAYGRYRPAQVRFDDLIYSRSGNISDTALYKAIPGQWGKIRKYKEISQYAQNVILRARQ